MGSKLNIIYLNLLYLLSPIIAAILYWFKEPVPFSPDSPTWGMTLIHMMGSIFGIISYIWMCFNILIMIKIKGLEKKTDMGGLLTFHTIMAVVALSLGFLHMGLLLFTGSKDETQIVTGLIGLYLFLGLMLLAIIFMTGKLIKKLNAGIVLITAAFGFVYMVILFLTGLFLESLFISAIIGLIIFLVFIVLAFMLITNMVNLNQLRISAYKKKFKYSTNRILHNITMLAVFIIFVHTLISFTARSSWIMSAVYFIFFQITFFGWITHKVVRRLRPNPDPYTLRKAPWDTNITGLTAADKAWALELIKHNPSIYPCIQCGTCTTICPVSELTEGGYNPRQLIEFSILGLKDQILLNEIPNVWECTQCYACSENCPQGVELPEIFVYLRNKLSEKHKAPEAFLGEAKVVYNHGKAVLEQPSVVRRREQLGLPPTPDFNPQEVKDLMEMVGLNKLFKENEAEEISTSTEKPMVTEESAISKTPVVDEKPLLKRGVKIVKKPVVSLKPVVTEKTQKPAKPFVQDVKDSNKEDKSNE